MKHLLASAAIIAASLSPLAVQAGQHGSNHHAAAAHKMQQSGQSIVDIAASTNDVSTLVAALKAADLVDALDASGPFTVFAPTNEAFAKLPEGTLQNLLKPENKAQLQAILKYHVVSAKVPASAAKGASTELKTLQGEEITVNGKGSGVTVENANVVKADVVGNNGIIHVIDTVLLPN